MELNVPSTSDVREAYQLGGDGSDFKRRYFERGEEFDAWRVFVTDEQVHAAAVAISPWAWEPGPLHSSIASSKGRDDSLSMARSALEAALSDPQRRNGE